MLSMPPATIISDCPSAIWSAAIIIAFMPDALGQSDIMVAGGMESMSNVPYYLEKHRFGSKLGHAKTLDGIIKDGLWDVYNDYHMGMLLNSAPKSATSAGNSRMNLQRCLTN